MKLTRVFTIALILSTTAASASSSLSQVRNSLWVFGVENRVSTEVEMVQQGIANFSDKFDETEKDSNVASQQVVEVPEELDMAISKFES